MAFASAPIIRSLCTGYPLPVLLLLGIILTEVLLRMGNAPTRFIPMGGLSVWSRAGCNWLLGLFILGTAYLGLGLAGLLFPALIIAVPVVLASVGDNKKRAHVRLIEPLRELSGVPLPWLGGILVAAAIFAVIVASPTLFTLHEDAFVYHLALPWQSLIIHRLPLEHIPFISHLPLPVDLTYMLPMVLGDDRLAKWIVASSLFAGSLFIAGQGGSGSGGLTMWLPLLLMMSADRVLQFPGMTKNDLVAAALFVVGAILWRKRSRMAGALFLGCAVAAKATCGPLAVTWMLIIGFRRGERLRLLMLFLLPMIPWLVKSWLVTGNPIFPALWRSFPSPFWGPVNQAVLDAHQLWEKGSEDLYALPVVWLRAMWRTYPLFVVLFPLLFLTGRARSALALAVGGAAALKVGGMIQYVVPGLWIEAVDAGHSADRITGKIGFLLRMVLVIGAVVLLVKGSAFRTIPWGHFSGKASVIRRVELTTYAKVIDDLRHVGFNKVLSIGGWRSYLVPGRVLFDGYWGETPMVWEAVRTSCTQNDVRRKARQWGKSLMLLNIVSIDLVSRNQRLFAWDNRMLRQYRSFCAERLRVLGVPNHIDMSNGGFYVLRFDTSSGPSTGGHPFFLPGAESSIVEARIRVARGQYAEARRAFAKVMSAAPGVAFFESQAGYMEVLTSDWRRAWSILLPAARHGYVDEYNLQSLRQAAAHLGYYDEAIELSRQCIATYNTVEMDRIGLVTGYIDRARASLAETRVPSAIADARLAATILNQVPDNPKAGWAWYRRRLAAFIQALYGDIALAQGRRKEAVYFYRTAIEIAPNLPESANWRRKLDTATRL